MTSPNLAPPGTTDDEFLIIGPSYSGKTSLLATLETAADKVKDDSKPDDATAADKKPDASEKHFDVFSDNSEMRTLRQQFLRGLTKGRIHFDPSSETKEYLVLLKRQSAPPPPPPPPPTPVRKILSNLGSALAAPVAPVAAPGIPAGTEEQYRFRLLDGPGEALFSDEYDRSEGVDEREILLYREQLIDQGKRSRGLIICVDADDKDAARKFIVHFLPVLEDMATEKVLPFKRVAVVLTKADKLVDGVGIGAQTKLEQQMNPWDQLAELIDEISIRKLMRFLRPEARPQVYCGWASVYGFVRDDGQANFVHDDQHGRMFTYDEAKQTGILKDWVPYRVLDPFVYVATGTPMKLTKAPDKWIGR